jgi:tetratricopeptide (TPR) repeat protein
MYRKTLFAALLAGTTLLSISAGFAQSFVMDLPRPSQHAVLTQRVGITDITVNYHRPLVNGRKVWGSLVPYGQVWRAGANENTTIQFTSAVSVEGQSLPAGSYGLHMIPNENDWTIIFSKNYTSWGSFTYNQSEDALRVNVKPQPTDMHEALTYDFDDIKPDAAVLTLRWEKLAVPVKIGVNTHEIVEQSLHTQLRGLAQYTWMSWDDAATYLLAEKTDYEEALKYADTSIQNEERFDNLMTKANVLDAMGKKDDASTARSKALTMANALQLHGYARQLMGQGKQAEAFQIFQQNAKKNPDQWVVHVGLSRMYSAQGDFAKAAQEMTTAIAAAPDGQKQPLQGLEKRLQDKQDINK